MFTLFGVQHPTDHMMVATFHPKTGWSAPEIKPYGPLTLDPACSCFQYCTSVFEGMKVTPPFRFPAADLVTSITGLPRTRRKAAPFPAQEKHGKDDPFRCASRSSCEPPQPILPSMRSYRRRVTRLSMLTHCWSSSNFW